MRPWNRSTLWAIDDHFDALLMLPADLPSLQKKDIEAMVTLGRSEGRIVVIAPMRKEKGTNGLFVSPLGFLSTALVRRVS